ncbi:MAG TPA: dockerin type I domain-containing protein, partial [Chthoniobacterales bacterium]
WPTPDNGGSTITGYNIYRQVNAGPFSLLANVPVPTFVDSSFAAGDTYRVTAVNGQGEGPYCPNVTPIVTVAPSPCSLPGVPAINDNDGDAPPNTPPDPTVNVEQLYVAEPLFHPSADKLVFTLQLAPSTASSAPPSSQWYIVWNRQGTDPTDPGDASYDRMFVAMKSDATGAISFNYGKFGIPLNEVPPPPPDPNANTPKSYGPADSGSYNVATGVVTITLSNNLLRAIDGGPSKYTAGTSLAALNVRTYLARPDAGQKSQNNANDITPDGIYSLAGNASCVGPVPLVSIVSAKTHGSAGEYDIPLPLTGSPGIECRTGGAGGNYTLVFTFANPLTSVTGASVTAGTGSISSNAIGSNPQEYVVNLSGVSNSQRISVSLNGISDTSGNVTPNLAVTMGVLLGDTTGDGAVNSSDVGQTKSQSGQNLSNSNFREDVTTDGAINSSDVGLVKAHSGTALP